MRSSGDPREALVRALALALPATIVALLAHALITLGVVRLLGLGLRLGFAFAALPVASPIRPPTVTIRLHFCDIRLLMLVV